MARSLRTLGHLVFALMAIGCHSLAYGEDTVYYRKSEDSEETLRKTGEVIDYTGIELRLMQDNGRELSIETERIVHVQSPKTRAHIQADKLFEDNKYREAVVQYSQAINDEKRFWVRRQILVQQIWCAQYLGKIEFAGDRFVDVLLKSDPTTQYFDAIPLAWSPQAVGGPLETRAKQWLQAADPAAQLLGASWLLSTTQQSVATAKLRQLMTSKDKRIALLAEAQTWRTRAVSAQPADIERWKNTVSAMPESLQGGPLFALAAAQRRLGQSDHAVLSYLRLPVLYPQHRELAASALLLAGDLRVTDNPVEARHIYQELAREYGDSPHAASATQRLQALKDNSKE